MASLERKVIHTDSDGPLMVLEKYNIDPSALNLEDAYKELYKYIEEKAGESYTWGYFPGMSGQEDPYPECKKLGEDLKEHLISQFPPEESGLELSFIRAASAEPVSEFGGMHIDVDKGIMHQRDPSTMDKNILRVLINLDDHNSRKLGFTRESADALRKIGMDIPADQYTHIRLPDDIVTKVVEIPPRESDAIYVLKFWSDIVPHLGITDNKGHFLAAYGMYLDRTKSPLLNEVV